VAAMNGSGIFTRRQDFSSFNSLPRHKLNSYHIKVRKAKFSLAFFIVVSISTILFKNKGNLCFRSTLKVPSKAVPHELLCDNNIIRSGNSFVEAVSFGSVVRIDK
jgi:hypothetical protein